MSANEIKYTNKDLEELTELGKAFCVDLQWACKNKLIHKNDIEFYSEKIMAVISNITEQFNKMLKKG